MLFTHFFSPFRFYNSNSKCSLFSCHARSLKRFALLSSRFHLANCLSPLFFVIFLARSCFRMFLSLQKSCRWHG
ncbi:hypothetical protein CW304_24285 [Bacillus sp. UFRGS-B20]|nr:hypothetical protein CW304_24285 [Bacillus sp. UFRGS-B20]